MSSPKKRKSKGKQKYKVYDIYCGKCNTHLLTYHKYGAGKGILRLYLANIASPNLMANFVEAGYEQIKQVPNLSCANIDCGEVLGVPALSKSKKWVFRMRQGYFHRKLIK